jgi:ethylbenzene dehydrogenase/cytochrome b561-like protein
MQTQPSRPRSDAPTFVLHWLMVASLGISLATGLRIAADGLDASITRQLSAWLPQGAVSDWHIFSAFAFLALIAAYAAFLWRARLVARVTPRLSALKSGDRATRWSAWNRLLYVLVFACLAVLALTGGLAYFAPGTLPGNLLFGLHQAAAWGLVAYLAAHVAAQCVLGGVNQLLKIFSPRLAYGAAAAVAGSGALAALAVALPLDQVAVAELTIPRAEALPVIDGEPGDAAWQKLAPVTVHTFRGEGLDGGETPVRVRAVHDGQTVAMLFEWKDATRSQKHLPIVKTEQGWKVMQSRYGINDENDFYEDKFAVMLSASPAIGGGATQLGLQPIAGKPAAQHGRGFHATSDGSLVDVWHWKSVRVGPLAQIDDNHFGPPLEAADDPKKRYTGGYTQDPKTGGGFDQNWKKIEGSEYVEPKRLPRDLAALQARLGKIDLDPAAHDEGEWWMALADTVPYSKELDTYPVGTVLPSVLIDKPFEGDRGDVRAVATWRDGWWRMEVSRKLDTGSKFDLPIASGTHLWVAAFDHNQARHTRHLHPLRIALQ